MVKQQPALGRFDRHRAGSYLGSLPAAFGPHYETVFAPVQHVWAHAQVDITERRMPVITRATEHDILVIDLTREGHAVAVIRQQGILQEMEFLEIESVADPDGGTMETIAPQYVITVLDPAYARVILVTAISTLWICIDPLDDVVIQLPIDPILAETAMHIHVARLVITAEYARECSIKRHNRTVENTVG